ncbi:putative phospholipid-binding protein,LysM domain-containing protein [Flammeovirgaceae bacterium 311]|nr:putative phospholipid-binding protein,LysM domain-containing protein [Flammeovirgaceae bacterium 311]
MGLKDFFRKGKEEKIEQKQPTRPQQPGQQGTGSLVDLQPKQQPNSTQASTAQDRQPVQNHTGTISPEYYEIKKGDTLSAIAKRQYGDASKWQTIYNANKDTIKNPDLIYPGQKIKLPKQ